MKPPIKVVILGAVERSILDQFAARNPKFMTVETRLLTISVRNARLLIPLLSMYAGMAVGEGHRHLFRPFKRIIAGIRAEILHRKIEELTAEMTTAIEESEAWKDDE